MSFRLRQDHLIMFGLMAIRPKTERSKPVKPDTKKTPPPRPVDDDDIYGAGDICAPEPDRDDEQRDL
ncbi:MAG TPA: hypothetical protein VGC77_00305 [Rhodopseudomonas sp.]|uniref:hypothetical protein n=1 Tax=Rhodopseudomonas sp. TaxID=1078 RepID=UPI002ED7FC32